MLKKHEDPIQQAIQQALPASCTIYIKTRQKSWSGSGYHIGNGYVCTASHVAPPEIMSRSNQGPDILTGSEIHITFDKKIYYSCVVIASDPNIDAAILQIQENWENLPSVMLANSDELKIGDVVAVLGSPELWHDSATVGRISNVHQSLGDFAPSKAWNDIILTDAKILQGVSGGMVIDETGMVVGSVIGVTGLQAQFGQGQNVICPSNKIINLIRQQKNV
jgi:S1-C subfamily serine protease